VSPLDAARAHLDKAREFLQAAEVNHELELYNAASSNAIISGIISGINSKDAICLRLTGRTNKQDNHHEARAELRAAGPAGLALESTFHRLLKLKPKSQYRQTSVSANDAAKAVEWATRMLDVAQELVSG
jgi:hypothetical protein